MKIKKKSNQRIENTHRPLGHPYETRKKLLLPKNPTTRWHTTSQLSYHDLNNKNILKTDNEVKTRNYCSDCRSWGWKWNHGKQKLPVMSKLSAGTQQLQEMEQSLDKLFETNLLHSRDWKRDKGKLNSDKNTAFNIKWKENAFYTYKMWMNRKTLDRLILA